MSSSYRPETALGRAVHAFEETAIAALLGLMTLVTFANVVVRYVFNLPWVRSAAEAVGVQLPTTIIWALEMTLVLFAWLVLFGIAYGFKITMHLGVDAVLNLVSRGTRRVMSLTAVAICLVYALLLMKGAWDYWAPFAGLDATTGRWFPTGFANSRDQGWYETEQIPIPDWLRFIEPIFNEGEEYEKLPRFIPYAMLPVAAALILFRLGQASWRIVTGRQEWLIVSHEAEDAVAEAEAAARKEG
ncbi:TRAP transporter small permease [Rhodovulum marinum]|uniref:TRAP transporter small permease protein n=1 Tax=Rhodovulum marinum TaxID=320662 RepID=A0A4R2Q3Q0_9RHOB|nr:TRAP transporter small permease [Rhodovulum marinum]TCP43039.1 C4-dicarboxylate transporter DctQ subunit [Rhodovulum marinum]